MTSHFSGLSTSTTGFFSVGVTQAKILSKDRKIFPIRTWGGAGGGGRESLQTPTYFKTKHSSSRLIFLLSDVAAVLLHNTMTAREQPVGCSG